MQFSNTTSKNGVLQRCEDYTGLGDGVITGDATLKAKFTANVNETVHELTVDLMLLRDDFDWDDPYKSDYPIATTPLVAEQRDYQFDNLSFLKLKRVDVSWDGTKYYRATPFDSTSFTGALGNDANVDGLFARTEPKYDPKAFGFWLYPRATQADEDAGGKLRIEFSRAFTEYTTSDTTKEPPIDRPFHELIPLGASLKWCVMKGDPKAKNLATLYAEGREKMKEHYSTRNEDASMYVDLGALPDYI